MHTGRRPSRCSRGTCSETAQFPWRLKELTLVPQTRALAPGKPGAEFGSGGRVDFPAVPLACWVSRNCAPLIRFVAPLCDRSWRGSFTRVLSILKLLSCAGTHGEQYRHPFDPAPPETASICSSRCPSNTVRTWSSSPLTRYTIRYVRTKTSRTSGKSASGTTRPANGAVAAALALDCKLPIHSRAAAGLSRAM